MANKENNQPVEPIQPPWKNILLKRLMDTKEELFIITPVLKVNVIKLITNILLNEPPTGPFKLRLMTKLNEEHIIDGKSDLEALELLGNLQLGPQFKLEFRGVENLNANVFIFDKKAAIIISGGLSLKALESNLEYGFMVTDQKLVDKICKDFDEYWKESDELTNPDFKYFIAQIQEHDTSMGGFLKQGSSVKPHGEDLEDVSPLEGETLAKKYLSEARDHEEMDEYEQALEYYNKALLATPNNVDILRDKAVLLRDELKRSGDALETFNKILFFEPKDERASLDSGILLAKAHKYWDALIKLDVASEANPGNETAWYWKGKILSDTPGRVEDAIRCLDEVIKIDPNNEKAWYLKGKILCKDLDRYSEADRCFNTVSRINPKNEQALSDKGKNLFDNLKKPLEAIKCFDRITKANKTNPIGWFFKGKILSEAFQKNEDAQRCFAEAIRLNETYKDALFYQGKILATKLSKQDEAKKIFEKLHEVDKKNIEALFELGLLNGKHFKDSETALHNFLTALQIRLSEEDSKKLKEDSEIKFDRYSEVLKFLDEVTVSNPRKAIAWYEKGAILDRIYSRFEDALKCFDATTKLDMEFIDAWYDKGMILFSVYGRNDDAIKCLNKVISLEKNNENAWFNKGKALMDNEKFEDALACFDKVIKINPKNVNAYESIANALIKLSRLKDAIEYFDKAIELDNLNATLWYNKGNVFLTLRKYPEALLAYKNALNVNPNHELALKNFEMYSDKNNWV